MKALNWIKRSSTERTAVVSFFVVLVFLFIQGILAARSVNKITLDFKDMYEDKLKPEQDLSHMLEKHFLGRMFLEEALFEVSDNVSRKALIREISVLNHQVDSIFDIYVNTHHFNEREKTDFRKYKEASKTYRDLEKQIVLLATSDNVKEAGDLFRGKSYPLFQEVIAPLDMLENDIVEAGKVEYAEVKRISQQNRLLMYINMGVSLIVAVIVSVILSKNYLAN